ncbi:MAG TPA: hypothetical protein VF175_03230, partial [Lacipirellula sp.]
AGTWLGVAGLSWNVYSAWWYITVWVWTLAAVYYLRYRTEKWKAMRVIDQIHHGHGRGAPGLNSEPRSEEAPSPTVVAAH